MMTEGNPIYWLVDRLLTASRDGVRIYQDPELTVPLGFVFNKGEFIGKGVRVLGGNKLLIIDSPPGRRYSEAYVSGYDVSDSNFNVYAPIPSPISNFGNRGSALNPGQNGQIVLRSSGFNPSQQSSSRTSAGDSTPKIPLLWWVLGGVVMLAVLLGVLAPSSDD